MQAVIVSGGKQFVVEKGTIIRVDLVDVPVGSAVSLPVLATLDGASISTDASKTASAKVMSHGKLRKIDVYKHHAKKRYRRHIGHRQGYTELLIESIKATK